LLDIYQKQFTTWTGRVEGLLARYWPELSSFLDIDSPTLLRILIHYGSPAELIKDPNAAAQIKRWGGVNLENEKIAEIINTAAVSLGVRCTQMDVKWVKYYANEALNERKHVLQCQGEIKKLCKDDSLIQTMAGVVGISAAAVLYVQGGDPANYSSGGAYLKKFGLNLTERSSGSYQGNLKISKRGSSSARRFLYFSAMRAVQKPGIVDWHNAKKARSAGKGLPSIVAVMRRLVLALYAIRKNKEDKFDSRRVFQPVRTVHRHGRRVPVVSCNAKAKKKGFFASSRPIALTGSLGEAAEGKKNNVEETISCRFSESLVKLDE
jgi:hypothetical protein